MPAFGEVDDGAGDGVRGGPPGRGLALAVVIGRGDGGGDVGGVWCGAWRHRRRRGR